MAGIESVALFGDSGEGMLQDERGTRIGECTMQVGTVQSGRTSYRYPAAEQTDPNNTIIINQIKQMTAVAD
jgi:hypothetical protein